jgi:hypothetical protein
MSRCERCRYALVKGNCPICGGRKPKVLLGNILLDGHASCAPLTSEPPSPAPLPLYWSPKV